MIRTRSQICTRRAGKLYRARSRLYQNQNQKSFGFRKEKNLGVCAKQKVRLTRLGKCDVVQYYTLYRCAEKSISLFRLPMSLCQQLIAKCTITNSIVTTLASTNWYKFTSHYGVFRRAKTTPSHCQEPAVGPVSVEGVFVASCLVWQLFFHAALSLIHFLAPLLGAPGPAQNRIDADFCT